MVLGCHFVNLFSFASSTFFLSLRKIMWLNSHQPKTRAHVEHLLKIHSYSTMYNFSGSPYWAYYREGKLAFSKSHTVKQICFFCVHRSDFNMTMCSKVSGLIGKRASWSSYHNTKAMRVRSKVYHVGRIDITWRICQVTSQPDEVTSESRKKIPSAVVYYYFAWYLFSQLRRYLVVQNEFLTAATPRQLIILRVLNWNMLLRSPQYHPKLSKKHIKVDFS